ncbi:hypothetical protein SETIT_9G080500v2 [Setaria italica]|uniref:Uncharacterized protein n=1 Tax=Setaria italica TaxID=4555 RepID=A0A368SE81_SETIT|nr:hypothetical protein SETIT_9G080500v2 [Setaria italica]
MEHLWTLLEAAAPSEDAAVDDVAGSRTSIGGGGMAVIGAGASTTVTAGEAAEAGAEGLAADGALELRGGRRRGRDDRGRRLDAVVAAAREHEEAEREVGEVRWSPGWARTRHSDRWGAGRGGGGAAAGGKPVEWRRRSGVGWGWVGPRLARVGGGVEWRRQARQAGRRQRKSRGQRGGEDTGRRGGGRRRSGSRAAQLARAELSGGGTRTTTGC